MKLEFREVDHPLGMWTGSDGSLFDICVMDVKYRDISVDQLQQARIAYVRGYAWLAPYRFDSIRLGAVHNAY